MTRKLSGGRGPSAGSMALLLLLIPASVCRLFSQGQAITNFQDLEIQMGAEDI